MKSGWNGLRIRYYFKRRIRQYREKNCPNRETCRNLSKPETSACTGDFTGLLSKFFFKKKNKHWKVFARKIAAYRKKSKTILLTSYIPYPFIIQKFLYSSYLYFLPIKVNWKHMFLKTMQSQWEFTTQEDYFSPSVIYLWFPKKNVLLLPNFTGSVKYDCNYKIYKY